MSSVRRAAAVPEGRRSVQEGGEEGEIREGDDTVLPEQVRADYRQERRLRSWHICELLFFHCDGALKGIYGCGLYCKLLIIGETGFDFTRFEILLDLFT